MILSEGSLSMHQRNLIKFISGFKAFIYWFVLSSGLFTAIGAVENQQSPHYLYLPIAYLNSKLPVDSLIEDDDDKLALLLADGLFTRKDGPQIVPQLAEKVSWPLKGLIVKISLKKVQYVTGERLKVEDVIDSLERCIRHSSATLTPSLTKISGYNEFINGKTSHILGLKKTGDRDLIIITQEFTPFLLDDLTDSNCLIVKKRLKIAEFWSNQSKLTPEVNATTEEGPDLMDSSIIATGPYMIEKRTDNELHLIKRPFYYENFSGPEKIIVVATPDYNNFNALFQWANMVAPTTENITNKLFNQYPIQKLGSAFLIFNHQSEIFKEQLIRQLVTLSLDFNQLYKELKIAKGRQQAGLFPFGTKGFKPRSFTDQQLQAAQNQMKLLGYSEENPLVFKLMIKLSEQSENQKGIWNQIFAPLPIRLQIDIVDPQEFAKRKLEGNFEALITEVVLPRQDPRAFMSTFLSGSKWNSSKSNYQQCDMIISKGLNTHHQDDRSQIFSEAENCLFENYALIPLYSLNSEFFYIKKPWQYQGNNYYLTNPWDLRQWQNGSTKDQE